MLQQVLRHPLYRRLFTAQVVSLAGTGLATVALGLLAYDLAGADAGLVLGTVFAIKMAAYVALGPLAAAFCHLWRPRTVLVAADGVRVLAALGLPFVTEVWQVYVLVLVLQAASAVHTPTYQALLPRVLTRTGDYTSALSLSRMADDLEMVASPLLAAALLLVVPSSGLFLGTAAGFALSAALVARLVLDPPPADPEAAARGFVARSLHGSALMVRSPALRPVLAINLAVAAAGAFVLVQNVVVVQAVLGHGEDVAAALLGALGAGSILVAVVLPRVLERVPERRLMLGGAALLAVVAALVPAVLGVGPVGLATALVAVAWFAIGAGWSAAETPVGRILRSSTADADLPAVYAAQFSLSHACWLVTYPLAGWLGARDLGLAAAVLAGVAVLGAVLAAVLWPRAGVPQRVMTAGAVGS